MSSKMAPLSDDHLEGVAGGATVASTVTFDRGELDGYDLGKLKAEVEKQGGTWHAPGTPGFPHGGVSLTEQMTLEELIAQGDD